MENRNEREVFTYTYSAKEQEELKRIREKYVSKEEDKMEQLRRLDRSVTQKGTRISLIMGILGTLIMGTGMCCTMVFSAKWFIPGIVIGVLGIAIVALAYPVYTYITKKERQRVVPEIIRLTDELMK